MKCRMVFGSDLFCPEGNRDTGVQYKRQSMFLPSNTLLQSRGNFPLVSRWMRRALLPCKLESFVSL